MGKRIYYNQLTKETANLSLKDKNIELAEDIFGEDLIEIG